MQHLLNTYSVAGTALDAEDTAVNESENILVLFTEAVWWSVRC